MALRQRSEEVQNPIVGTWTGPSTACCREVVPGSGNRFFCANLPAASVESSAQQFAGKRRMHREELAFELSGRFPTLGECHNQRGCLMPSPFRMAAVAALFLSVVVGPARSQELAPPGSGVSIYKQVIDSAFSHTVKYYVKGGSPRLQALVRKLQWAENEVAVVEQLQVLRQDIVTAEQRVQSLR